MASLRASGGRSSPAPVMSNALTGPVEPQQDPFNAAVASPPNASHQRFSNFDSQISALGPNASPAQAKRALEAHLAETDRRMEEAGKLGTALVQQRKDLSERLKEVEKMQTEGQLSDDLRQKLVEIEKDYNEVARESARAFLPKQRVPSNEASAGSPFVPEGKGGRRSVSPSKFEAQATGSPTKFSVPNRKVRNQPSNRIHDIEFAAEISTSLIAQVRNLQGLLAEKEEELKDIKAERSKLEYETEGFQQRVKALDESEHRYKDENWNLETQIHDLLAKEREAADREKKLTQAFNILQAERNAVQRELDEAKLSLSKLSEEVAAANKQHDIELGTAKRNIVIADSERSALRKKIDDLTGQNQELAKAVSASQRAKFIERESILGMSEEDFETANDKSTPDQSPPQSPVKGTPRHSMLESETLKTSLGHAQRTIQGLRNNVHREKTEKLELRRMLQEARDELEKVRSEPPPQSKRARKAEAKELKKPLRLLGGLRTARSEVLSEDSNWEDQPESISPTHGSMASRGSSKFQSVSEEPFETANETSDAAFETANEPVTETDDFHTGEEFSSDDAETETETPSRRLTPRNRPSFTFGQRSGSMDSTASTEDDEYAFNPDIRTTPTMLPPLQARFPLRVSRGAFRRSRQHSEDAPFTSSPPSLASSSIRGTPKQSYSLAAELGDFDGSDNESALSATPSRRSLRARTASPPPALPPMPRAIMIDNGTMTDSNGTKSRSSSDAHAVEIAALLVQHDRALREMTDEKAAEYASALEELKSRHAEQLSKAQAEASLAHSQELEVLKANHEDAISKSIAEVHATHAQELQALGSTHTTELSTALSNAQSAYAQELEALKSSHAEELSKALANASATHAQEIEELQTNYANQITKAVAETQAAHAQELDALKAAFAEQLSQQESENKAAHDAELEALKSSHTEEALTRESELKAAHASELETLKAKHMEDVNNSQSESHAHHASEIAALAAAHASQITQLKSELFNAHAQQVQTLQTEFAEQLDKTRQQSGTTHSEELNALKASHSQQLEEVKSTLAAAHAEELNSVKAAHAKYVDDLKKDNEAQHSAEIAALIASHSKEIESVKAEGEARLSKEISALKELHAQEIDSLNGQHAVTRAQELQAFKAAIDKQTESSKAEGDAALTQQIEALNAAHVEVLEAQKRDSEKSQSQAIESLKAAHERNVEVLRNENAAARSRELEAVVSSHLVELDALKQEHESSKSKALEELRQSHLQELAALSSEHESAKAKLSEQLNESHSRALDNLRQEVESSKAAEIAALEAVHADSLRALKNEHEVEMSQKLQELTEVHAAEIEKLAAEHEAELSSKLQDLANIHSRELDTVRHDGHISQSNVVASLTATHAKELESLKLESETDHSQALEELKIAHTRALEEFKKERDADQAQALEALRASHSQDLARLQREADATLERELNTLKADHANALESFKEESAAEKEHLLATHAAELEALRKSLEDALSPPLGFSRMNSTETEPVETHRRPQTPTSAALGLSGRKGDKARTIEIAEDDTRQSPSAIPGPETPESQRPFKELSTNTNVRPSQKQTVHTFDQSSQTTLTSGELHRLLNQGHMSQDSVTIKTAKGEVTVTPFDDSQARQEAGESGLETLPARRPGSSSSGMPPLPANHREAIEAARTGSSSGGKGTMAPPMVPASAFKAPTSRPDTPSSKRPMSPLSARGTPTPRAGKSMLPGRLRSRQSSVSSFASEIDTRFNNRNEMPFEAAGFGPNTDPRMIQAITQTMIGEYLWKYTRKTGRGEMSENRHRRYFWVHPYTKTLYWSDRDPAAAGRSELKAKSIPIEAVRIVGDDNPMPPGLHRKSLVIISPGRTVKFTCTTGQRHETWFNALSYLLLRSGNEPQVDTEEVATQITLEDVDEFNPSTTRRPTNGNRARPPPSLSSYNSRTTRGHESPNPELSMNIPTLTPTRERESIRSGSTLGTLGRLSGYWKSSTMNSFSSLRSRSHLPQDDAIYEASEVPDSAEDLRKMIEQQDRESDRLENVRACCDGKHDVGTLSHTKRGGRLSSLHSHTLTHSHTHTHPGPSTTPTPSGTTQNRT